ncbi:hypothetical protein PPUJ20028_46750 [Pseudomonas putida]|uniref:DJ-1/PfpI domain-containing protein n=1 Tax=Pseudomonas putida TaxID=303 RepID=A0AA37RFM3_PSEPU|nr:hypothetical protein PPUJ20028_46750 [Pseudomonas putida]GLO37852.1 hypothetical protein PPUN14671_46890 [Pseudomonas putida]
MAGITTSPPTNATFESAQLDLYDALVLPGGVQNSDTIRLIPGAQNLIKSHDATGKPLAVICHGGWLLVPRAWPKTSG